MALTLDDVAQQMRERGIEPPAQLFADGKKITWAGNPAKPKKKNAWCVLHEWTSPRTSKTYVVGVYGMGDQSNTFRVEPTQQEWSPAEKNDWLEKRKALEREADAEIKAQREKAAEKAQRNWEASKLEGAHAYLDKKKVGAYGIRFFIDKLVIPMRDASDKLHGLQYIMQDGSKTFGTGTAKEGHFHTLGDVVEGMPIVFAEGYATAASAHMATGWPAVTCFDAGNLMPVITTWRKLYPDHKFIIAADDDKHLVSRMCERLRDKGAEVDQATFSKKQGGVRDMQWELPDGRKLELKAAYKQDRNGVYYIEGAITLDGVSHILKLENAGRSKGLAAAKRHGARMISPEFELRIHSYTDFNDLHCAEGLNKVREQLMAAPSAEGTSTPKLPPSGGGGSAWGPNQLQFPFLDDKYVPRGIRENVYYALNEDPVLQGMVRLNDFSHRLDKMREAPWRGPSGKWKEIDDTYLAHYLATTHGLIVANPVTIQQAVKMYATDHAYNPVREQFEGLVWDGIERRKHWLHEVMGAPDTEYSSKVGCYFLDSIAARVFEPGCQMDYMMILHGGQGAKKSSVLRVLGGEYFAGGSFRVGDKDSLQVLQGRLIFNFNEFDALAKAERTAVKQFVTERVDVFRPPYEKGFEEFPRSVCLTADTNEHDFLRDPTGNRRSWVVGCSDEIDVEKMQQWRDQLFAEAVASYKQGNRRWPDKEEQETLFKPEQEKWVFVNVWQDKLALYVNSQNRRLDLKAEYDGLTSRDGTIPPNAERDFFSTLELLVVGLGLEVKNIGHAGAEQKSVAAAMQALGFTPKRCSDGARSRGYLRIREAKKEAQVGLQPAQAGSIEAGKVEQEIRQWN